MNPASQSTITPLEVLRTLARRPGRWLVPAAIVALLAGVYALARPATWEASQALIIRNEATNSREVPGKFSHSDEMKTVQETILELSRSRGVLSAALTEVGPPDGRDPGAAWPSAEDVSSLRDSVKLAPPKGAEFGKTEVFYLKVRDRDRDRAVALAGAICDKLQSGFQQLRDAKARSMIDELVKSAKLARADLAESTGRLTDTEKLVGSDLAELRILQDSNSGESVLRRTMTEIEGELRATEAAQQSNRELLDLLRAAQEDPGRLVAMPNRLLESQPALRRLKDGLVDAQLHTAQRQGRMSDRHPLVLAALEAEREIRRNLHDELPVAIRGVEVDLRLNAGRVATLQERLADAHRRLEQLAPVRAPYTNLLAENRHRTGLLERAEQNLAEARAAEASAKTTSLIARIDAPDAGTNPVGPSRAMIVLVGIAGGLLAGFGLVFLTYQPAQPAPDAAAAARPTHTAPQDTPAAPANGKPAGKLLPLADGLSLKMALAKLTPGHTAWN